MCNNLFNKFFDGIQEEHQRGIKDYFLMRSQLPDECNKKEYAECFHRNAKSIFESYSKDELVIQLEEELGELELSHFLYRMGQGRLTQESMELFRILTNKR